MSAPSNALFRQLQRIPQHSLLPHRDSGRLLHAGRVLLFETTDRSRRRNMLPPGSAEADNARKSRHAHHQHHFADRVQLFHGHGRAQRGRLATLPRVLPGLISDRRNQLILGNYWAASCSSC